MQVVLAGTAASREAILTFKDALEQLPNIATVDIPVNQLLKQANVTFEATITLK